MSNLIPIQNNSYYYFKSDKVSVYPCAYRGSNTEDDNKYFDPASRYTSEKNITGAVVGLIPNGTYISYIPTTSIMAADETNIKEVEAGIWKFTIGGYNFEAQIDADDLNTLTDVTGGKAVLFEIQPREPSNLAGLGNILTSFESTAGNGSLDQKANGIDYCFTGLKVTVTTTGNVGLQPTSTQLTPVLYTGTTLILNPRARLPEITHGLLEGEAEVAKLNVLENITLADADAKDLLVEDQLIVGTAREDKPDDDKDETIILKVTLDRNPSTGAVQNPSITIDKAPVTIYTDTDKALSVEGGAEIKKSLTVTKGLKAANGTFEVDSDGNIVTNLVVNGTLSAKSTTITGDLTVKDSDGNNEKLSIIGGQTTVTTDTLTITGATEDNTLSVEVTGNTTIDGTLGINGSLSINNTVNDTVNTTFSVNSAGELITKSVKADTLYVPDCNTDGSPLIDSPTYTSFSLGLPVTEGNLTTRSLYFHWKDENEDVKSVVTPTTARAQLLNMIYPVGSIYMTMEDLTVGRTSTDGEYAIFDPQGTALGDVTGGLWKQISQGRVLLGAGEGTDAEGNKKTFSTTDTTATGGYYNPQAWAHTHNYDTAKGTTGGCNLKMEHLPRKEFTLRLSVAEAGGDKSNVLRWCVGSGLDDYGTTDAGAGNNARLGAIQIYTGNDKWKETEGWWKFHYGGDSTTQGNTSQGEAHTHSIPTDSVATTETATESWGNLPPYLVCYIWQRVEDPE